MQTLKRFIYAQNGRLNRTFFVVGLMICYLMISLLVWVFQHLQPIAN